MDPQAWCLSQKGGRRHVRPPGFILATKRLHKTCAFLWLQTGLDAASFESIADIKHVTAKIGVLVWLVVSFFVFNWWWPHSWGGLKPPTSQPAVDCKEQMHQTVFCFKFSYHFVPLSSMEHVRQLRICPSAARLDLGGSTQGCRRSFCPCNFKACCARLIKRAFAA